MAEPIQEKGRKYVNNIKEFLESTTYFDLPFTAYEARNHQTTMIDFDDKKKIFDLKGYYKRDNPKIELFIEAKDYSSKSTLDGQYKNFIKDCFSIWVKERKTKSTWMARFIFISSHPFYCQKFSNLKTIEFLKKDVLIDDSNESNKELLKYLENNLESVYDYFIKLTDVLFITKSCDLIKIDLI